MTQTLHPAKQRAIHQWSNDPCGPTVPGMPGYRAYFEALDAGRRAYAPWMAEALRYDRASGLRVLDLGCGQGIDLVRYAAEGAEVTGVDITPRHVDLARRHLEAMGLPGTVIEADAEALPLPSHTFDIASSNGVLHHTPDMPAALRELHRVLKPGGAVAIIVYNRQSLHYWIHQVMTRGILCGGLLRERSMDGVLASNVERTSVRGRPLVRVYSARQVRTMLTNAGFCRVTTEVRGFHATDTVPTRILAPFPHVLSWIGRRLGWYVVARAAAGGGNPGTASNVV